MLSFQNPYVGILIHEDDSRKTGPLEEHEDGAFWDGISVPIKNTLEAPSPSATPEDTVKETLPQN